MKKFVLVNVLLLCACILLHAQIDCEEYVKWVDSQIKTRDLYISNISKRDRPDVDCEIPLLEYTKGKGYIGDSTSFYINMILSYLSESGNIQTTREHAINELLLRNYHFDVDANYRFHKEDFNEQALSRLKNLLRKQYTQTEEMRYIQNDAQYLLESRRIDMLSDYEANKRQISYEEAKDSIIYSINKKSKNKLYDERYSIHLPLLIGWHNMHEFIPLLDSIQNSGQGGIRFQIALARMGNKQYHDFLLNKQFQDHHDQYIAFYIGTQDFIAKYGELLYSEEEKFYISGSPELTKKIPLKYNIIIDLQSNIANFPKLIDRKFYICYLKDIDALPSDILEKARQWMKENRGNYVISPDFSPYFDVLMLKKYQER